MSLIERAAARLNETREKTGSDLQSAPPLKPASELAEVALREEKRRAADEAARRVAARQGRSRANAGADASPKAPAVADEPASAGARPEPSLPDDATLGLDDAVLGLDIDSPQAPKSKSVSPTVDPRRDPVEARTEGDASAERRGRKRLNLRLAGIQAEYYLTRKGTAPAVVSQFRSIRRPLIANAQGRGLPAVDNGRTIMVTSAMPGEGKTFCSIHLALAISAELDCQVILLELDLIKPSIMKTLGVGQKPGITDWFRDTDAHVRDYVLETSVRDLSILPSGTNASGAANMLASKRLEVMFEQLHESFPNHFLVLDTPPVIPASEARVLTNYAGQVAFVVAAGETPTTAVNEGLEHVQGCEVVGMIMNKFRPEKVYSSYGY